MADRTGVLLLELDQINQIVKLFVESEKLRRVCKWLD